MAKPLDNAPALLVLEAWGLGDVALAVPFLHLATRHACVTLLAQPHAAPILRRFAPDVRLLPFSFPWTAFDGKYRLHRWPWPDLVRLHRELRGFRFDLGISARPDPRDHAVLALSGARRRLGFPRCGSSLLLTDALPAPAAPHRARHWDALAERLGWTADTVGSVPATPASAGAVGSRRVAIHTGAARPTRRWPVERWEALAARLHSDGWEVVWIDDALPSLDALLDQLATCGRFLGNDSGPGHLAALLGIPTFTLFGPQTPSRFAPVHPRAAWLEGGPCRHKPCHDACRYAVPHCLLAITAEAAWPRVEAWLNAPPTATPQPSPGHSAPS